MHSNRYKFDICYNFNETSMYLNAVKIIDIVKSKFVKRFT